MSEKMPEMESGRELPSKESIRVAFELFLNGKEYKEIKFKEENGVVIAYEIQSVNDRGYKVEYNYQRAKYDHTSVSIAPGARYAASIHVTEYDSDDIPIGGKCVANLNSAGDWEAES